MSINILDKSKGCLVGLACGDYLGMPYEFMSAQNIKSYFKSHKLEPRTMKVFSKNVAGYYTDDTALTICLAGSLIEKGFDTNDQLSKYRGWLYHGHATPDNNKAYGVGQQTVRTLIKEIKSSLPETDDPKAGGNGALMRCAPIGIMYYKDKNKLIEYSLKSAIVTHNNKMASWSCVVLNSFISYALQDKLKKEDYCNQLYKSIKIIPDELQNLLKTNFNKLNSKKLQTTGYSLYTLKIALYAFFTTKTFKDCLTKAVTIGGDTDTQGAVAGALAGAYYGHKAIPLNWRNTLMRHNYIEGLATKLYKKTLKSKI